MRLQKYIASCGIASRRAAEILIAEGKIAVNGRTVREMGFQVQPGDIVTLLGRRIHPENSKHVLAYYKPHGEVATASDPQGRPTVLARFRNYPVRLHTVGRLDFDSEGLLLLTNDGELTLRLTHPRYGAQKTYFVRLGGRVERAALETLRNGVLLDGRMTAPALARVLRREPTHTELELVLREGRNRQVRRMAEAIGHPVLWLVRTGFGPVTLTGLRRGEWRELSPDEIETLKV